jgi:hypothetical protein
MSIELLEAFTGGITAGSMAAVLMMPINVVERLSVSYTCFSDSMLSQWQNSHQCEFNSYRDFRALNW